MKIKKFLFHFAVTLVILFGGLLVIDYLQSGQIDGIKLIGLAGGLLLLGVVVILRGMGQANRPSEEMADKAAAPVGKPPGSASLPTGRADKSKRSAKNPRKGKK